MIVHVCSWHNRALFWRTRGPRDMCSKCSKCSISLLTAFRCVQMRSVWTQNISSMAMNSGSMRSTTRANAPCTLGGLRLSRGTSVPLVPGKNVAKTSCYNATVIRFRVSVWSVRQTCASRANRTAPNLACKFVTRHGLKMSNHLKSIWTLYIYNIYIYMIMTSHCLMTVPSRLPQRLCRSPTPQARRASHLQGPLQN